MKRHYVLFTLCFLFSTFLSAQNKNGILMKTKKGSISFATEDSNFKFGFGGSVYMDAAGYFDDKTDLGSGSEMRDIRLLMKATLWKNWFAKIDIGLAGGETAAKDVFLQYNINKTTYVRAGHYAEPFGLDYMESSKYVKYITPNSTTEAFAPGRKVGFEYVNWGQKYWFAGGLFGDADINNTQKGDEAFALTGRFVFNPMTKPGSILHFGLAGSYRTADAAGFDDEGNENTKNIRYRSRAATHVEGRRFIDAKVTDADYQTKYAIEFIGAAGPIAIQSEYFGVNVERKNRLESYSADGWYVQAAWLISGGKYKYSNKWARLSDPGVGSWELVARYNSTDLNNTDANILGGKQKDFSLGINYKVNKLVKIRMNYSNIDLDENALNGKENFGLIQTRLQFSF